ncbi:hypothetical protein [Moraxella bovis]|uniref:Uncharacterized protein n=1 Tax=Moraxella bovis TaxID=476 RepID=A0A1S9ZTA8_MORBO|nr:hypothetical protein [Moraxella bovis]AWY19583.1 hypothetical protein DQF64_03025 [Moraxella bovis]OOR86650.1 hypothetical protein B0182_13625 [Moraxella bovis]UYZ75296.1 hypothetical protein LP093_11190 [Moraxella bovis]UYZ78771.1 hypothetical protein LP115_02670 [Moraxella bovis]UYZ80648.1 hypothetical protein LP113_11560 [Moraxella bovis]
MQNDIKQTYRYLFKLPSSVLLIVLFVILMVSEKQALAMLLKGNGVMLMASIVFGIWFLCERMFEKLIKFYCTNGKFPDKQLINANNKAKWISYLAGILLIIGIVYVRSLIKMAV